MCVCAEPSGVPGHRSENQFDWLNSIYISFMPTSMTHDFSTKSHIYLDEIKQKGQKRCIKNISRYGKYFKYFSPAHQLAFSSVQRHTQATLSRFFYKLFLI